MNGLIIGTSGHIDHGKTTLLKALTGIHLDSSPEEKKRGITIDLGFTHMTLPSGRNASFIDVPGHEKLVRTMIAGASGMDAVLLCVSAVEGVMPQTIEHMAILSLLGIEHGVIALTMTDLVDEDLLELAELDIEDATAGTPFAQFPVVHTAVNNDNTDLSTLIQALDRLPSRTHNQDSPFRLPIDRVFVQSGFGTVVTGTAKGDPISIGEVLHILPSQQTARVRAIQLHGTPRENTSSGQRTALNLAGVSHQDIQRGQVLIRPNSIPNSAILDIHYTHLADAPTLQSGDRVRVLIGSSEYLARMHFYDEYQPAGTYSQYAQIRLSAPACTLPNDRLIIRRESPVTTLGGGLVIDPWAPKMRKKNRVMLQHTLEKLHAGENDAALERCGSKGMPIEQAKFWGLDVSPLDGNLYANSVRVAWQNLALNAIKSYHSNQPLSIGIPLRELHSQILEFLTPKAFAILMDELIESRAIRQSGARLYQYDFQVCLTSAQQDIADKIKKQTLAAVWEGINMPEQNLDLIHYLLTSNQLISIQNRLLHPNRVNELVERIHHFFSSNDLLTPVDFKAISGLSRKHAIPWLEWLDSSGITQRMAKGRVLRAAT